MRDIHSLIFVITVVCLSGCGTLNNMIAGTPHAPSGEATALLEIYGGVKDDLRSISDSFGFYRKCTPFENGAYLAASLVTLADVPLSFVGDTLTLWMTIPASLEKREADQ